MKEKREKIYLTNEAALKMKYFTTLADGEISGMAKSYIDVDDDVIIDEIIIFEQECSSASTEIDDKAQAKFLYQLQKRGEDPSSWNVWWHSHSDMDVFWSGTDDKTIANHSNNSHLISIVTNKKNHFKARVDIFPKDKSPFKKKVYSTSKLYVEVIANEKTQEEEEKIQKQIDKLQDRLIKIQDQENEILKKLCEKEIKEKVKSTALVSNYPNRQYYYNTHRHKYNRDYAGQQDLWACPYCFKANCDGMQCAQVTPSIEDSPTSSTYYTMAQMEYLELLEGVGFLRETIVDGFV